MIRLNGVEIKPTIFPDGTSQVWKIPEDVFKIRHVLEQDIVWDFENEAEFMHVAQLCDLLEARGMQVDCLYIPYFPYARQDKEISNQTTFAKKTFVKLLETLTVKSIHSYDIHSFAHCPKKSSSQEPYLEIITSIKKTDSDLICFPDTGAKERYGHLPCFRSTSSITYETCSFSKERDQSTGHIKNLFLNELVDVKDKTILIVDDLTDGGMTFKLCAEKLLQCGAKSVNLYTTHGIYSKGIQTLKDSGISRVFNRKGEVTDET
jgi:ribose-phosphate pyrophosphokinase